MRIGELSRRTGASPRSLRHYEAVGLLASTRTESGYREYDVSAVRHVERIRLFLKLGYTLEEAREVLSPLDERPFRVICADVIVLHHRKLEGITAEIRRLTDLQALVTSRLAELEAQRARGGPVET